MAPKATIGIAGLGQMGGNLARHALDVGLGVVGYTRSGVSEELRKAGVEAIESPAGFRGALEPPRIVLLYVPAGEVVDEVLEPLAETLEDGDVVVDGGNSYWGDSIRRHARLAKRGLRFVDLGTSGGVSGARCAPCLMAGGDPETIALVEPILERLAVEGGYVHAGPPGAGHFVKLVHNGIEFGMLQAIGEGMALLERYPQSLPVAEVLRCWRHGSVIRSWLIDLMEESYRGSGGLAAIPPFVEDTGEVNWLVDDALHLEVPVPVIAQSVMQLLASRDSQQNWARAIAMMRHRFGGHPYGEDEGIRRERREGRVGSFVKPE